MKKTLLGYVASLACGIASVASAVDLTCLEIEREIAEFDRAIAEGQAKLGDRCSLADFSALVRSVGGTNVWTAALQSALDSHGLRGSDPTGGAAVGRCPQAA